MVMEMNKYTFRLGALMITPGVEDLIYNGLNVQALIKRHMHEDWGDLSASDKEQNNLAVINGHRILSSYKTDLGKIWIITEADRSSTTVLLPSEY
jgi:hypothetical protein